MNCIFGGCNLVPLNQFQLVQNTELETALFLTLCVCVCVCVFVCVCMCVCVCVDMHLCLCIHKCMHVYVTSAQAQHSST